MARIQLTSAFNQVRGKLNRRDSLIFRQKEYRAENGKVLNRGSQESYQVLNPRDYEKNPPKGAELRNINTFAEASRLTTLIIRSGKLTGEELSAMSPEERERTMQYRAQLLQFTDRFMAQLKKPDPQAPVLPKTDPAFNPNAIKIQRRQYRTLNTFIRAMLIQSLKME